MSKLFTIRNFVQNILQKLRNFFFRFPLRANFFILIITIVWVAYSIHKTYSSDISLATSILFVLLKVLLVIAILLIVLAFLTSILPYIHYIRKSKLLGNEPEIQFQYSIDSDSKENVVLSVKNKVAYRPLFGTLKVVLVYDNGFLSKKYELWKDNKRNTLFSRLGATGEYVLELPEIKNYQLHNVIFFFEDMFHLFSFSNVEKVIRQFSILPKQQSEILIPVQPHHAKDTVTRTETVRKQEGEWLHFKSFEPSDDVRRIVWTIYARNKELVVRLPELQNMYASQVSFYSSFYNMLGNNFINSYLTNMLLNTYKNKIWSLFSSLLNNKEIELKYIPDQVIKSMSSPEMNEVMYEISASHWHTDLKVDEYFNPLDVSVLCISSLTPIDDLTQVAKSATSSVVIVFIQLSKIFQLKNIGDVINQFLVNPNEKEGKINKLKWLRSPLRTIIMRNERKIKKLFQQSDATFYDL